MTKSGFRLERAPGCLAAKQTLLVFCLIAALLGSCSYDAGKLHAPAPRTPDGAIDTPASFAMDVADGNGDRVQDDSARIGTGDDAAVFSDVASSVEVANPDDVSLPIDLASASETPAPDDGTASRDGPSASEDAGLDDSPLAPDVPIVVEVSDGIDGAGGGTDDSGSADTSTGGTGPAAPAAAERVAPTRPAARPAVAERVELASTVAERVIRGHPVRILILSCGTNSTRAAEPSRPIRPCSAALPETPRWRRSAWVQALSSRRQNRWDPTPSFSRPRHLLRARAGHT